MKLRTRCGMEYNSPTVCTLTLPVRSLDKRGGEANGPSYHIGLVELNRDSHHLTFVKFLIMSLSQSVFNNLALSVCLPSCLSVPISVRLSVCLCVCLRMCAFVCLFVCLSTCLYVYLSAEDRLRKTMRRSKRWRRRNLKRLRIDIG